MEEQSVRKSYKYRLYPTRLQPWGACHCFAFRSDEGHLQAHIDAGLMTRRRQRLRGASAHEIQAYQPSASQLMVTVLGIPASGRRS
jgi:hypothetical protein